MISRTRYGSRAFPLMLAGGLWVASVPQAGAQTILAEDNPDTPAAETFPEANDADIKELDWSQLNVDASTLSNGPAAKPHSPQAGPGAEMSWSSRDMSNGAAAVSVKQPLSPFWDAQIGAD